MNPILDITEHFVKLVEGLAGVPVRYGGSVVEQDEYPLITYKFTNAKKHTQIDVVGEQWESDIELVVRSDNALEALTMALELNTALRLPVNRDKLYLAGVAIAQIFDVSSRDDFITIDYEHTAGFDVTVRTQEKQSDTTEEMGEIIIKNNKQGE